MITPSFGLTASERVLPRLALDWTTGLPQAGVDVVRAGVATFVGSNGFIQAATENTQRVDYSSGIASFLVEETRTNLCVNSENFTLWANAGVTITAAATDAPTGTLVAQKIAATSSGVAERYVQQSFTASAAAYTFSISIQPAETQFITIRSSGGGISDARTGIDVVNKTITRNSAAINAGATVKFFNEANGFTRIELTITFTAATTSNFRLWLNTSLNNSSSVDMTAGDGLYYFGGGIELGSSATSYIPTGATAVTRNADVPTMTGTNFSDWYKAGVGSILVKATQRTISGIRPIVQLDDTTADNFIVLRGNTTNPELYIKATTDQAQIDAGTIAANTAYRLAGSWATNSVAASVNSGAAVLDGSATIPTVTQMRIGSDGTNYLNGWIQSIEYYDQQLFPSNLQLLSASKGNRSVINTVMTSVAGSVINRVIS